MDNTCILIFLYLSWVMDKCVLHQPPALYMLIKCETVSGLFVLS